MHKTLKLCNRRCKEELPAENQEIFKEGLRGEEFWGRGERALPYCVLTLKCCFSGLSLSGRGGLG